MSDQAGCTAGQKAVAKADLAAYIDCAKTSITDTLVEAVAKALVQGADGWQTQLDDLGKAAGGDALACAAKTVKTLLSANANGKSSSSMSPAGARAVDYISAKGWRYTP